MIKIIISIINMFFGNTSAQRFKRLMIILITIGIIYVLNVNLGYDKTKGGFYWKPLDAHVEVKR